MPDRDGGQHSKIYPDFSKSIQDAKAHVRSAKRWCYGVLTYIVLILGGASMAFYLLGDALGSWVKTGLSASLSLLFASLIREFSTSLKRSREVEDQVIVLGIYAACGDHSEAEKILKGLKIREKFPNGSESKRPWFRKVKVKSQNPPENQSQAAS